MCYALPTQCPVLSSGAWPLINAEAYENNVGPPEVAARKFEGELCAKVAKHQRRLQCAARSSAFNASRRTAGANCTEIA
eukprot:2351875-Rhodomonas_salina.1